MSRPKDSLFLWGGLVTGAISRIPHFFKEVKRSARESETMYFMSSALPTPSAERKDQQELSYATVVHNTMGFLVAFSPMDFEGDRWKRFLTYPLSWMALKLRQLETRIGQDDEVTHQFSLEREGRFRCIDELEELDRITFFENPPQAILYERDPWEFAIDYDISQDVFKIRFRMRGSILVPLDNGSSVP